MMFYSRCRPGYEARSFSAWVMSAAITLPSGATADYFTGNEIHQLCETDRRVVSGYVAGWLGKREEDTDVMLSLYRSSPASQHPKLTQAGNAMMAACIPEKATLGRLTDVFCKAIETAPEVRHEGAAAFLSATLFIAFPCSKD